MEIFFLWGCAGPKGSACHHGSMDKLVIGIGIGVGVGVGVGISVGVVVVRSIHHEEQLGKVK